MSSRGFKFPLSVHWVAIYAFALVSLFGVYLLSFSDIGYFRSDNNAPAAQPPPATAPLNPTLNSPNPPSTPANDSDKGAGDRVETLDPPKPGPVKIVGLVFFGRRDLVRVLDCYLKVTTHYLGSHPMIPCPRSVSRDYVG